MTNVMQISGHPVPGQYTIAFKAVQAHPSSASPHWTRPVVGLFHQPTVSHFWAGSGTMNRPGFYPRNTAWRDRLRCRDWFRTESNGSYRYHFWVQATRPGICTRVVTGPLQQLILQTSAFPASGKAGCGMGAPEVAGFGRH